MASISDREIIERIQNGEINFFELLVKKYSRILHSYAKKKVKNQEDAEDIVQTAFINSYKTINRFDLSKTFYPFIFTILKNEIAQFYRKNRNNFSLNEELISQEVKDFKLEFAFGLENIKPEYRRVLELYYLEGFTYKEIAFQFKKPINTIKTLIRRAKIEMKKII